ncbi:ribose 5-phosphate isomerase A, partial [Francisella tularensis subsp. holarctica]|nr:ribose 5-phosphate isomerase A [Francisella tularensis subsp. holarctica]
MFSKEVFLVTYLVRESFKMFFNKKNNKDDLKKIAATEAAKSITKEITLG